MWGIQKITVSLTSFLLPFISKLTTCFPLPLSLSVDRPLVPQHPSPLSPRSRSTFIHLCHGVRRMASRRTRPALLHSPDRARDGCALVDGWARSWEGGCFAGGYQGGMVHLEDVSQSEPISELSKLQRKRESSLSRLVDLSTAWIPPPTTPTPSVFSSTNSSTRPTLHHQLLNLLTHLLSLPRAELSPRPSFLSSNAC